MAVVAKTVTTGEESGDTVTLTAVTGQRCWSVIYLRDVRSFHFGPHNSARKTAWTVDSGGGPLAGISIAVVFGTMSGNTGPIGAFGNVDHEVSESYNVSGYTWTHRIGVKVGGIMPRLSGTYGSNWDWGSRLITVV